LAELATASKYQDAAEEGGRVLQ